MTPNDAVLYLAQVARDYIHTLPEAAKVPTSAHIQAALNILDVAAKQAAAISAAGSAGQKAP